MGRATYSAVEAREQAKDPLVHLLWVTQAQAARFQVRGWVRLEPPRDGGVMFLHRERQQAAIAPPR
jgi:hypothetical protein